MKRHYTLLLHILFWIILLLKDIVLSFLKAEGAAHLPTSRSLLIDLSYTLVALTAFYGAYFLVGRGLIRYPRKLYLGALNCIFTLLLTTLVRYLIEFYFLKPLLGFDNYAVNKDFTFLWFIQNAVLYYWSYLLYGLLYAFAENYFHSKQKQREREKKLLEAELAFLRSQINPHFLFNSINDIYALTLIKSDLAPNALLKLSDLLRYALYKSQKSSVRLSEEIDYLQSYIELETISQQGKAYIKASFSGDYSKACIPPMLLVPFVENAFKHGKFQDQTHPVEISAELKDNKLLFRCYNSKKSGNKDSVGGIGLSNIKRRLELEYEKRYQLEVSDKLKEYEVKLTLHL